MFLLRAVAALNKAPPVVVTVYRTTKIDEILEAGMKVKYDPEVDVLMILLNES